MTTPIGLANGAVLAWMNEHILFSGSECLDWPFAKVESGYGRVNVLGKSKNASQIMCQMAHGEAPTENHQAAHLCGKGHLGCVNPQHLQWQTPAENNADKANHGTLPLGERVYNATISDETARKVKEMRGKPYADIEGQLGVKKHVIGSILSGRTWRHV